MRAESHSSLSTFNQCPWKYYLKYIARVNRFSDSEALVKGRRVHLAISEKRKGDKEVNYALTKVKTGKSLRRCTLNNRKFSTKGDIKVVDGLKVIAFHEQKFGFNEELNFEDFDSPGALFRGIIDYYYVVMNPPEEGSTPFKEIHVYDWKTGKPRFDKFQLNLYALFLSKLYQGAPVTCYIVNTTHQVSKPWDFTAEVRKKTVEKLVKTLKKIDEETIFRAVPTNLCGWCDYQDGVCKYSKKKTGGDREKLLARKFPLALLKGE